MEKAPARIASSTRDKRETPSARAGCGTAVAKDGHVPLSVEFLDSVQVSDLIMQQ